MTCSVQVGFLLLQSAGMQVFSSLSAVHKAGGYTREAIFYAYLIVMKDCAEQVQPLKQLMQQPDLIVH
jgi:hypothetical protein